MNQSLRPKPGVKFSRPRLLLALLLIMGGLTLSAAALGRPAGGAAPGRARQDPERAEHYRKKAAEFRKAQETAPEHKKPCLGEWVRYYDCLAARAECGCEAECDSTQPSCRPVD
ncbi:MAG: hypothetical protein M3416_10845 [Acidobacteriota bacterium]|nr:hypothetical protein [Acidobacteriota bacterium]